MSAMWLLLQVHAVHKGRALSQVACPLADATQPLPHVVHAPAMYMLACIPSLATDAIVGTRLRPKLVVKLHPALRCSCVWRGNSWRLA